VILAFSSISTLPLITSNCSVPAVKLEALSSPLVSTVPSSSISILPSITSNCSAPIVKLEASSADVILPSSLISSSPLITSNCSDIEFLLIVATLLESSSNISTARVSPSFEVTSAVSFKLTVSPEERRPLLLEFNVTVILVVPTAAVVAE